jgi:hypothetical protein
MNPDPFVEFDRSVIRIPVAGPPPNNVLVFVRASALPENATPYALREWFEGIDDETNVVRRRFTFSTLYKIDGYAQSKAREYRDNTQVSVTAFLSNLACVNDDSFVSAVDEVEGRIKPEDGSLEITALLAEQDTEELTMRFTFSAWILTYEPRGEFPVPHERNWSLEDAIRVGERVTGHRPSDSDRVKIFDK